MQNLKVKMLSVAIAALTAAKEPGTSLQIKMEK